MKPYEKESISLLRAYPGTLNAERTIQEECMALDEMIRSIKKGMASGKGQSGESGEPDESEFPETGMAATYEEESQLAQLLHRRDEQRACLMYCMARRRAIERALSSLSERERTVLDLFFVHKPEESHSLDVLMEQLGYEKTHIYRIRSDALLHFSQQMTAAVP